MEEKNEFVKLSGDEIRKVVNSTDSSRPDSELIEDFEEFRSYIAKSLVQGGNAGDLAKKVKEKYPSLFDNGGLVVEFISPIVHNEDISEDTFQFFLDALSPHYKKINH